MNWLLLGLAVAFAVAIGSRLALDHTNVWVFIVVSVAVVIALQISYVAVLIVETLTHR
jgi:hypothetical protein